jgi:hypothetical protein
MDYLIVCADGGRTGIAFGGLNAKEYALAEAGRIDSVASESTGTVAVGHPIRYCGGCPHRVEEYDPNKVKNPAEGVPPRDQPPRDAASVAARAARRSYGVRLEPVEHVLVLVSYSAHLIMRLVHESGRIEDQDFVKSNLHDFAVQGGWNVDMSVIPSSSANTAMWFRLVRPRKDT